MNTRYRIFTLIIVFLIPSLSIAQPEYLPARAVYDVSTGNAEAFDALLDRVSYLQQLYDNDPFEASIVLVIHEEAVPLFARGAKSHVELMQRAESLTAAEIIQFRLCGASARIQGFAETDFYAFVSVIPMADAEIVQLQNTGYAYMR